MARKTGDQSDDGAIEQRLSEAVQHTIRHYDQAKVREPVEFMPRQMAPSERFVKQCGVNPKSPVPVGNSILLSTDIESGDAPALCQRSVAQFGWRRSERSGRELFIGAGSRPVGELSY